MKNKKKRDKKNHIRVKREKYTIKVMIEMYCHAHHGTEKGKLCNECSRVLDYAIERIDYCAFGIKKPACETCPIHCFKKDMREQMRNIMRYAGPRMTWKYPILAFMHIFDLLRGKKINRLYEKEANKPNFKFKMLLEKI